MIESSLAEMQERLRIFERSQGIKEKKLISDQVRPDIKWCFGVADRYEDRDQETMGRSIVPMIGSQEFSLMKETQTALRADAKVFSGIEAVITDSMRPFGEEVRETWIQWTRRESQRRYFGEERVENFISPFDFYYQVLAERTASFSDNSGSLLAGKKFSEIPNPYRPLREILLAGYVPIPHTKKGIFIREVPRHLQR
jgi:hypothetical protein